MTCTIEHPEHRVLKQRWRPASPPQHQLTIDNVAKCCDHPTQSKLYPIYIYTVTYEKRTLVWCCSAIAHEDQRRKSNRAALNKHRKFSRHKFLLSPTVVTSLFLSLALSLFSIKTIVWYVYCVLTLWRFARASFMCVCVDCKSCCVWKRSSVFKNNKQPAQFPLRTHACCGRICRNQITDRWNTHI